MNQYIDLLAIASVGAIFFLSGSVKLNDPLGFAYQIEAYLQLLANTLTAYIRLLLPYTLILAIGVATLEVVLGAAVLVRWQYFWTLRISLLLILFFTCLTLYTAISKRMPSCGCFGDALELTPWQSFLKSVVLLCILGGLYGQTKDTPTSLRSYCWVAVALLFSLGLSRYTLTHLPLLDFLPYKVGSDLTKRPPGVTPSNTHLHSSQGTQEITQSWLEGNKLLIIIQHPSSMTTPVLQKLYELTRQVHGTLQPILLTPNGQGKEVATALTLPLYTANSILLKTMLRAPVGLLLLQDGLIVHKWHYLNLAKAQRTLKQLGWMA